jgi:hypothetical protein
MKIIALDPGKLQVYGAIFKDNQCAQLVVFNRNVPAHARSSYHSSVVEKPNIMNVPNTVDMVEALWSGAIVASALSEHVVDVEPAVWKGTIKKPIHHGRVWEWMTPFERALFPPDASETISRARLKLAETGKISGYSQKWHNHLDALAIGMFYLGRIKRGGLKGHTNV